MWRKGTRKVLVALLCVMAAGCGGGDEGKSAEGELNDSASVAPAGASGPVTLKIQMTGLLLLVSDTNARTHIAAPRMQDHLNYIGFWKENDKGCDRYNYDRSICYIKMDGYVIDPVASGAGTPNQRPTYPRGVVNLTHASGGHKVNASAVRGRSRSTITLVGGATTGSCSLTKWTFRPFNAQQSSFLGLVNRLDWDIGGFANSLLLVLRKGNETRNVVLRARNNVIELLILNVPERDTVGLFGNVSRDATSALLFPDPAEMEDHFRTYYRLMGVSDGRHRFPMKPFEVVNRTCPITILGLATDTGLKNARDALPGIRTHSCVVTSAST